MRFLNDCIVLFVHTNPDERASSPIWSSATVSVNKPEQASRLHANHRPRQQPRLLRVDASGDAEHQPCPLSRPALQILYNHHRRTRRHGGMVIASTRSYASTSILISACRRSRHSHAPRRRGQTRRRWRRAARAADGGTVASEHANFHNIIAILRDDRRPTPSQDSAGAPAPDRTAIFAYPIAHRSGISANRSTTRSRSTGR